MIGFPNQTLWTTTPNQMGLGVQHLLTIIADFKTIFTLG
jgi:hypothetical protein